MAQTHQVCGTFIKTTASAHRALRNFNISNFFLGGGASCVACVNIIQHVNQDTVIFYFLKNASAAKPSQVGSVICKQMLSTVRLFVAFHA